MQSDNIQITVPNDELDEWKGKLVKNKTYEMMNFKVLKNDIVVKACTHPYRLAVTGATIIKEVDFPQISIVPMRFKDFSEILAGHYRTDLLTGKKIENMYGILLIVHIITMLCLPVLADVIGAFHEVTNTNQYNGRIKSVTFLLKDTWFVSIIEEKLHSYPHQ